MSKIEVKKAVQMSNFVLYPVLLDGRRAGNIEHIPGDGYRYRPKDSPKAGEKFETLALCAGTLADEGDVLHVSETPMLDAKIAAVQANRHPTRRAPTPVEVFYAERTPVAAIDLAISDHRAYAGGAASSEFIQQLQNARALLAEVESFKETALAALCVAELNDPAGDGVKSKWPAWADNDGVEYGEIKARLQDMLVRLHWR